MPTIHGVRTSIDSAACRAYGYSGKTDEGSYVFQPKGRVKHSSQIRRIVVSGVVCPACKGPLARLDPRDGTVTGRVIAVLSVDKSRKELVLDPLPKNLWAVRCKPCRLAFVVPKRGRESAMWADAVDPQVRNTGKLPTREERS